jgi:selenocysteine-specific elongation factor
MDDLAEAVRFRIASAGLEPADLRDLGRATLHRPEEIRPVLGNLAEAGRIVAVGERWLDAEEFARGRARLRDLLDRCHRKEPLRPAFGRAFVREQLGVSDPVLAALIDAEPGVEPFSAGRLRRAGFEPELTGEQAAARERIEALVREARFATPRESEIPGLAGCGETEAEKILDLLRDGGVLLRLSGGVLLHAEAADEAKEKVAEWIRANGPLNPADLKELFGMSRKYSIPLLEWLDETRFTIRTGQGRLLA